MAASTNDKITDVRNAARPNSTTVSSGRSAAGTTLSCANLTGWPTASKVHFVTYSIDSNSNPVAGTQLDCSGIVSGNDIGSLVVIDGTDTGNAIGDIVEMLPTAAWGQDLADGITAQHSRVGAHVGITNTGGMTNAGGLTTDTLTVSSGTTLPAGDIGTADLAAGAVTPAKLATGLQTAYVATNETTTSTSYTDLSTTTDTVTVTVPSTGMVLLMISRTGYTTTGGAYDCVSFTASGANTIAAADDCIMHKNNTGSDDCTLTYHKLYTTLTPGSTTFKMQYRVTAGTGNFSLRRITAIPLG